MIINLTNLSGISLSIFPDKQTHVCVKTDVLEKQVDVITSLSDADDVLILLQTVDAIKRNNRILGKLTILYFYGARSDRQFKNGDSIDALIIVELVNNLKFLQVEILDIHSSCISGKINNYSALNIKSPLCIDNTYDYTRIIPDMGAINKYNNYKYNGAIQCMKQRLSTNEMQINILGSTNLKGNKCIIKDDLIDGGRTFIEIAKKIKTLSPSISLTLECTHGIFSRGSEILLDYFDKIIVSDSYKHMPSWVFRQPKIKIIPALI